MILRLEKHKDQIFKVFSRSHFNRNAQFTGNSTLHEKSTSWIQRRRGTSRREAWIFNSSTLPLSRLLYFSTDCSFYSASCKIPCLLPHPFKFCHIQEKLPLIPKLNAGFGFLPIRSASVCVPFSFGLQSSRGVCSLTERNCEENVDYDSESERESCSDNAESVKSEANPEEVDRVCRVVHELFALDRNMEAVLDECGVSLSHDLVVDVLERFKHAWKPAFRFFCWASRNNSDYVHNSRTYNAMMSVLGKTRQFETMVSILEEMGEKGELTLETFIISMKAFVAAKERKKALGIFELMKKYNFKAGVETINCLLDELGRARLGKEAQTLFEKLENRFTPNLQTFTVLLNGWCRVKNLLEAGKVWNEMINRGLKPDIVAHNIMLGGLLKCRKTSDAIKLFEIMKAKGPDPNVRSYTILIRDLCKQNKMREAAGYLDEMLSSGSEPDAAIYTCLITGYGNDKKMDMVYALLKEMKEKGCPPDGHTYNALIKLMTNRRMTNDAIRLYKKMIQCGIQPTIHTYNMLMKLMFMNRNCDLGCEVWEEMIKRGCCPDENSYIVLIGGLIRHGRSAQACKYLEEMLEKGMKAPQLDYYKFAADFSRAGKANVLEELAQKMNLSGKFEVSNFFSRQADMMMRRGKSRDFG